MVKWFVAIKPNTCVWILTVLTLFGPLWLSYAHETKDFTEISFYHRMESRMVWWCYWKNFEKTISRYRETECTYKATSWLWSHSVNVRFQFFTAMSTKKVIVWDLVPCSYGTNHNYMAPDPRRWLSSHLVKVRICLADRTRILRM
jgi:hypothetical protein